MLQHEWSPKMLREMKPELKKLQTKCFHLQYILNNAKCRTTCKIINYQGLGVGWGGLNPLENGIILRGNGNGNSLYLIDVGGYTTDCISQTSWNCTKKKKKEKKMLSFTEVKYIISKPELIKCTLWQLPRSRSSLNYWCIFILDYSC